MVEVLRSALLTSGPKVEEFEGRLAALVGAKHAVAVNSATAALHLAMRVAGVGAGDRVVTSPNTFLASANAAAYTGATPDFSDVDPVAHNLDPEALRATWRSDTKAVVAVDFAGQPCAMPALARVARDRGAVVIEDASHALGGGFNHDGRSWNVGGHPWADATVFSFHPVKTITTGEGGMFVTDRKDWADAARRLRSHGVDRAVFSGLGEDEDAGMAERGPWYYEMQELGYNYRLPDVLCALGLSQLDQLAGFISRRREIVARYNEGLKEIRGVDLPGLLDRANRDLISWHLYVLQIDFEAVGKTRTEVMAALRSRGVGTQVHYIPVHLQPWYRRTYGYRVGKCPAAEAFYRRALSLPLFPAMTDQEVSHVIGAFHEVIGTATR